MNAKRYLHKKPNDYFHYSLPGGRSILTAMKLRIIMNDTVFNMFFSILIFLCKITYQTPCNMM